MKKKLLSIFKFGLLLLVLFLIYQYYIYSKEKQRRATYYENLVDTASPTVTVLRDSILIGYRKKIIGM